MAETTGTSSLASSVDAYLHHASVERGLSRNTIQAYSADLARFTAHLAETGVGAPADVRREHVAAFVRGLEAGGLAPSSRARCLVAVRRWLRFAEDEGWLEGDPTQGIESPRLPQKLPRVLRPEESAALCAAADPATPLGQRDRAMLEVLYGAGLRVSELVGLPASALGPARRDAAGLRQGQSRARRARRPRRPRERRAVPGRGTPGAPARPRVRRALRDPARRAP